MELSRLVAAVVLAAIATGGRAQTWSREDARELLGVAEHVGQEGLDPAYYDIAPLRAALAATNANAVHASASKLFLQLASDYALGHVRNRTAVAWHLAGSSLDDAQGRQLMLKALAGEGVGATLQALLPQSRQYLALKSKLASLPPLDKAGIRRLRANLERWRWMPRDLGQRYLLVNVAAFSVSLIEDDKVVASRRVIVGKPSTPTPQFGATVTGMVLNPWWDIPPSIVRESIGRLVATNSAQARAKGYVVSEGHYRQRPGPGNALGQIKLVMANPYHVYLHDTPNKELFDAEVRAFSHGCIRTQDPFGLAESLLRGQGEWNRARMDRVVAGGQTTPVQLARPLPIYVVYFTASVDENGLQAIFPDVYGRDVPILAGLHDQGGSSP